SEVKQKKVVAEYQDEHRRDEQIHVREEARITVVVAHIVGRVQMNEKANEGDDEQHQQRHGIEIERDFRAEDASIHPGPKPLGEHRMGLGQMKKTVSNDKSDYAGGSHRA